MQSVHSPILYFQGQWANYQRVRFLPHAQNEVINSIQRKIRVMNSFSNPFIRKWQIIHYIIIFTIVVSTSLMHIFNIFRASLLKSYYHTSYIDISLWSLYVHHYIKVVNNALQHCSINTRFNAE